MKTLILAFLLGATAVAQTLTLVPSVTVAQPGSTFTLRVVSSASAAAGLQWTVGVTGSTAGLSGQVALGDKAAATQKTLACKPDQTTCLIYGMNQTAIGSGDVATYTVSVPAGAPSGTISLKLSGVVGVRGDGTSLTVSAGPEATVIVPSKYDLVSDGKLDMGDVTEWLERFKVSSILGIDFNGDSQADVRDLYILCLAVIGILP
jgi:hypothetical protein